MSKNNYFKKKTKWGLISSKGYFILFFLFSNYFSYSQQSYFEETSEYKDTTEEEEEENFYLKFDEFGFSSIENRMVDNKGRGDERFNGVRNFRVVLYDLLYRGGGNNLHLKDTIPKYYLWNPMPLYALRQLKEQGFNQATYLYAHNFEYWYPPNRLDSLKSENFTYKCEPKPYSYLSTFFDEVMNRANKLDSGKMLIHCWNGWHQAGMLSAFTLMQFCDYSNEDALKYWETCTDGNHKGYKVVKDRILNYKRDTALSFTDLQKDQYCPCLDIELEIKEQSEDDIVNLSEDEMMEKQPKKQELHVVKKGDSLSGLSLKYKTTIEKIKAENNLESDTIFIDQTLIIP
tara:strand:- start:1466 stop:2500 length:1035 start_codon:yes stop_codon:yes gene_type:complete